MVKSGGSIHGFCYFIIELWGHEKWDIVVKDGKSIADIEVKGVYGNTTKTRITFKEIPLSKAAIIIPGIESVGQTDLDRESF